ncbi:Domain of unknown function DUF4774 [Cinara cedri]|uniref:DUF4774 domain-containing protein n=1 Tax=Cinara cedri TaxID=506608 RepID=A0A5E4NRJ6_9HEMI|nr:Domain of unknown function DUF4774 [Cinara cedri]
MAPISGSYPRYLVEHRGFPDASAGEEEAQAVPFYGGGKGKYLIIHPSGRTTVEDHKPMLDGPKDDDEENVGQEGDGDSSSPSEEPPNESVSVNLPPDNASVAEAKPVGLAIAGPGGVASSKPVATAVVGPGGLALAKPVATAIAGIPGAEALVGVAGSAAKQKSKVAIAATTTTSPPAKKTVPVTSGKTKRSALLQAPDSSVAMIWPTYPLYKIPESHSWGFILRPVHFSSQAN